jgi:hypothetical protein
VSARDVGRLVRLALDPRTTAARDTEYEQLIGTYLADLEFRTEVDAYVSGQGLAVVDASPMQLVLSVADPDSPYAFRRDPGRPGTYSYDERVCAGLIHLAIACLAYPTARDLVSDRTPRLSVLQVDRRLRAAAGAAREEGQSADRPSQQPELERAWALYDRQPQTRDISDKRAYMRGTLRWVGREFEWLAEHALARRETDEDGGRYRLTRRHRVLARQLAVPAATRTLLELAAEEDA